MELQALDIKSGYGSKAVLDGLSLAVPKGQIVSVIGPNGSGKSTLLKTLARMLAPSGGSVLLDGKDIHRMDTAQVARRLSLLPQTHRAPEELSVRDFVSYGRFPRIPLFGSFSGKDREAVDRAIALTSLEALEARALSTLSGGERQRAWIALNLAQEPETMLLDEPTTFLDLRHQYETLELIRRMNRELGMTIVMVLHDLNHASRFSHRIVALKDGRIFRQGSPTEILTCETIREVFEVEARIVMDEGAPFFIPVESRGRKALRGGEGISTQIEGKAMEYGQA